MILVQDFVRMINVFLFILIAETEYSENIDNDYVEQDELYIQFVIHHQYNEQNKYLYIENIK